MEKFKVVSECESRNVPKWFQVLQKEVGYFKKEKQWQYTTITPMRKNRPYVTIIVTHGKTKGEAMKKAYLKYLEDRKEYRSKKV